MRDPQGDNPRWRDSEYKAAINMALQEWHGRVQIPKLYALSFVSGTYEYTLPDYIDTRVMDVQAKHTVWGVDVTQGDYWDDIYVNIPNWRTEPDGSGGQRLVIDPSIGSTSGRIIWYDYNEELPADDVTLNATIDGDDTSAVLDSIYYIGRSGFVKMNDEWMGYSGDSNDGSNTTISNLVRNVNGTTAATHTAGDTVHFGIAAPSADLWMVLFHQVAFYLHTMFLTDGAPRSTEAHERVIGLHKGEVQQFWRGWVPIRSGRLRLSRLARSEMPN